MAATIHKLSAKLISTNYEKLYWSIDEQDAHILKTTRNITIKETTHLRFGKSYNISTKILDDTKCHLYGSLTRDALEIGCKYNIVLHFYYYTYMGKSGYSMTSYIKKKIGERGSVVNEFVKRALEDTEGNDEESEVVLTDGSE